MPAKAEYFFALILEVTKHLFFFYILCLGEDSATLNDFRNYRLMLSFLFGVSGNAKILARTNNTRLLL